jgi:uncharacterized protein YraI
VKNANVRAGRFTEAPCLTTLPKGTRIEVLERVAGGDWYKIARGGQELGYIYGRLIVSAAQ